MEKTQTPQQEHPSASLSTVLALVDRLTLLPPHTPPDSFPAVPGPSRAPPQRIATCLGDIWNGGWQIPPPSHDREQRLPVNGATLNNSTDAKYQTSGRDVTNTGGSGRLAGGWGNGRGGARWRARAAQKGSIISSRKIKWLLMGLSENSRLFQICAQSYIHISSN